jgi:hypothetical protein
VAISLVAGIAIVATFHRKTTTKIVSVGPTSSSSSSPTSGSGSNSGSQPSGGSTEATGSAGGTTQPGSATTSGKPPTGSAGFDSSCTDCGQSSSSGRCSGWTEAFANHSNTDITGITFDPPSGKYVAGTLGTASYHTWPTPDPASVTLNLDIKPQKSQTVRFLTCTSLPPPASNAFFVATAPARFSFQWITGQRGSACFGSAC